MKQITINLTDVEEEMAGILVNLLKLQNEEQLFRRLLSLEVDKHIARKDVSGEN